MATGNGLYKAGEGHRDLFGEVLDECASESCGELNEEKNLVIKKARTVKAAHWQARDEMARQQSTPLYTSLMNRSDVAARNGREDIAATMMMGEITKAAREEIKAKADDNIAQALMDSLEEFAKAITIEECRLNLPLAMTKKMTLDDHARRVEVTRSIQFMGARQAWAAYQAVLAGGDLDECQLFESGAETFMKELAEGGTAKLAASNPSKYQALSGVATDEVDAAYKFLGRMEAERSRRVPSWLTTSKGVYAQLENIGSQLCGEHVSFMSPGQSARLWTGTGSKLPSPLTVHDEWPIRFLNPRSPLPGWSEVTQRFSNGTVTRAPAVAATTKSY
jgi:hypothetical protein